MLKKYFPKVEKQIPYEGRDSKNSLAFKYYNKDQKIGSKTMAEHLRFSVVYWDTFMGTANLIGNPIYSQGLLPVPMHILWQMQQRKQKIQNFISNIKCLFEK